MIHLRIMQAATGIEPRPGTRPDIFRSRIPLRTEKTVPDTGMFRLVGAQGTAAGTVFCDAHSNSNT